MAEPEELDVLGLGAAAGDLAEGRVVVLAQEGVVDGRVRLHSPGAAHDLPAVAARHRGPLSLRLPAALVSPALAAELGADLRPGRAVFSPGTEPATDATLVEVADRLRDVLLLFGPTSLEATPTGASWDEVDLVALESGHPVALGDEPVHSDPGGELNAVPYLSKTRDAGRAQVLALGALAVLIALAGTALVLGGTRSDDAVLDLQGASAETRATMAAIQAAVLTGTTSLIAAVAGIGLPALAFSRYNARPRAGSASDIPLVVPWELLIGLAALPVATAVLAALVTALRRPVPVSDLDDLAW